MNPRKQKKKYFSWAIYETAMPTEAELPVHYFVTTVAIS
jgi:hypothetical protein